MGRYDLNSYDDDDEMPAWAKWLLKAAGLALLCGFVMLLRWLEK